MALLYSEAHGVLIGSFFIGTARRSRDIWAARRRFLPFSTPPYTLPMRVSDGCEGVDAGGEDGGGGVFAKIDNFCVKVDIMGRDCASVEGKRRSYFFHTEE